MRKWSALLLLLVPSLAFAASPAILQGHWMSEAYLVALQKTRSPLEAANVAAPEVFSIERAGTGWKLTRTNYHEATWHIVRSLDAVEGQRYTLVTGAAETTAADDASASFPVAVDTDRRHVTGPFWSDTPTRYRRVDEEPLLVAARILLIGEYRDAKGRPWTFSPNFFAKSPELGSFRFEPVLDTSEACCNYFLIKKRTEDDVRIGFKWEDGRLELYRMSTSDEGCPISCEPKPFAVLTPVKEAGAK